MRTTFFQDKKIKKLRRIAGGDTLVIIYLKMLLACLENDGLIFFDGLEDNFADELALSLDEDVENVQLTLAFLQKCGLIEQRSASEFFLTDALANVGCETDSAVRMRKHRLSHCDAVPSLCDSNVQNGDTEIEKEKIREDLEEENSGVAAPSLTKKDSRHSFGQYLNVLLTDEELHKLQTEFPSDWSARIERLSEYMESSGRGYKNHFATIRAWAKKDADNGAEKKEKSHKYDLISALKGDSTNE